MKNPPEYPTPTPYQLGGSAVKDNKIMNQLNLFPEIKITSPACPTSMQYRLDVKGVRTIRNGSIVDLEYDGVVIARPMVNGCPEVVKRVFGIDI